jgi:hypothetical protein
LAHQLAWMYVYGYFPKEMDHIDRDPLNNRFTNLRDITHSNNSVNSKTRWDNSSGQKGVCFDKQKGKWKVQATIAPGKRIAKHFCCFEEAAAFYKEQMNLHRGEYTPV